MSELGINLISIPDVTPTFIPHKEPDKEVLTGKKNSVNLMLTQQIAGVVPIEFVECSKILDGSGLKNPPLSGVVFVNRMDVGSNEKKILGALRSAFPYAIVIAIHTYTIASMKESTIRLGYDDYISIFNLSSDLPDLLLAHNVKVS